MVVLGSASFLSCPLNLIFSPPHPASPFWFATPLGLRRPQSSQSWSPLAQRPVRLPLPDPMALQLAHPPRALVLDSDQRPHLLHRLTPLVYNSNTGEQFEDPSLGMVQSWDYGNPQLSPRLPQLNRPPPLSSAPSPLHEARLSTRLPLHPELETAPFRVLQQFHHDHPLSLRTPT